MLIACRGETAEKMKTSIRAAGSEPIFHTAEELKRKYGYGERLQNTIIYDLNIYVIDIFFSIKDK